jgi:hypothetical protein
MAFKPFDKGKFLELWKLLFPESYTEPIEMSGDGEGYDVPSMMAKIWQSVDSSMNVAQQGYFLMPHSVQTEKAALGARKALGQLQVRRTAPIHAPITIPAGTLIQARTSDSGPIEAPAAKYITTLPLTIGEPGPLPLYIEAFLPGTAWNLEAPPAIAGYGKGFPDDPAAPFPGSPYHESDPTPWYRWEFIRTGTLSDSSGFLTQDNVLALRGLTVESIGRHIYVYPETVQEVVFPRVITAFTQTGPNDVSVTFDPPIVGVAGEQAEWAVATYAELGVSLAQDYTPAGDITGGLTGTLDAIGSDRRLGRAPGELDGSYRERIAALPEIITPNAIKNITGRILDQRGIPWEFLEVLPEGMNVNTPGLMMGFTWDVHPYDFGQIATLDKPFGSQYVGQGGVFLPGSGRFFIIVVEYVKLSLDYGLTFDDGPLPAAWDGNMYDGNFGIFDPIFLQAIQKLWASLNAARAAGIGFLIVLK